jgi:hypothetical protein
MEKFNCNITKEQTGLDANSLNKLKGLFGALVPGSYALSVRPVYKELDKGYYLNRFWAGISQLRKETGNDKRDLYERSCIHIYKEMYKTPLLMDKWVNAEVIEFNEDGTLTASVRFLTEDGWPIFYNHFRKWAKDEFESIV